MPTVLYDAQILRCPIAGHHANSLRVLPHVLQRQNYGIAVPRPSPLREPINLELLEITRSEEWAAELER
jgi:ABC-type amino acid transport substrate-binding protein